MPPLKRRKAGVLEEEFSIRGADFACAVAFITGRITRGRALEYLMERRWSQEDARLYLEMAEQARL
jgi:hypothetical protein